MTREGACMRKAVLVVKVTREEMSVRLQVCSYWWKGFFVLYNFISILSVVHVTIRTNN